MTNVLKCFSEIPEEVGAEVDSTYNLMIDRYLAKPLIVFHMGNSPSGKFVSTTHEIGSNNICPFRDPLIHVVFYIL